MPKKSAKALTRTPTGLDIVLEGPGAINSLMSERALLRAIIDLAHMYGWRVAHFRPGMSSRVDELGRPVWVTPVQADGRGFPDLVCVRDRVLFIEAKSEAGELASAQRDWRDAIAAAGGEHYVFRPSDWLQIEGVLR